MTIIKILSCPVCNGTKIEIDNNSAGVGDYIITCKECSYYVNEYQNIKEAIKIWNKIYKRKMVKAELYDVPEEYR